MKRAHILLILIIPLIFSCSVTEVAREIYPDNRPLTRWWWFADIIEEEDIADQLSWLSDQGFGGVEIAWVYPLNRMEGDTINRSPRTEWLSSEWSERVLFAKKYGDSLGLVIDFTFGSLWPFGDLEVPPDQSTRVFGEPDFRQWIKASWDYPEKGLVLDHLNKDAFENYAERMGRALSPSMNWGSPSALFVDSWEVDTRNIWTSNFEELFEEKYAYNIVPFMEQDILSNGLEGPRYDYMKLVSELIIDNFFVPFTQQAQQLGGFSRGQASGSPTDILKAYGMLDVPESEAMLYEPYYTRIVSSAAALYDKPVVTAETFTCLYGWPRDYLREEKIEDLKVVADAMFAHGLNQVIWHGMPYNPSGSDSVSFYASVHVGKAGNLSEHLKPFNEYLTAVSTYMRQGKPYSDVAIYLPLEDAWIAGEMPKEKQYPWAWGEYELRYLEIPEVLRGRQPLWINGDALQRFKVENGHLVNNEGLIFNALYVDAQYLDPENLRLILDKAEQGLPVILKQIPQQAGFIPDPEFDILIRRLSEIAYKDDLRALSLPLLDGPSLPYYWCREMDEGWLLFFAHPEAKQFTYPIRYGQSEEAAPLIRSLIITVGGKEIPYHLHYDSCGSILLKVNKSGDIEQVDLPDWKDPL